MNRTEAFNEMKKDPYLDVNLMEQNKRIFLEKLNLSEKDFEKIMADPVKCHEEYPISKIFLNPNNFLVKLAKKIITKN